VVALDYTKKLKKKLEKALYVFFYLIEQPGKFRNVVLEKDGDQLDRSCEK
jgi:hypothetical protein